MFGFRFSLKSLLGLFVVVSIAIVVTTQWRYRGRLTTYFLDPTSAEAKALLSSPVLADDEVLPTAEYRANYRDVRWLFSKAEDAVALSGGLQADFDNDRVVIRTSEPGDLKQLIRKMAEADHLEEDHGVIRGIAVDENDRPVANLPVDLLGPSQCLNAYLTRPDGSFSVPIEFTPSDDYTLRFRRSYAETYQTMPFSLRKSKREVVVRVVIPQKG
ncbi:hypothetical protein [Bremerella sp. P1]|uniref:hypothetical protein n=1 Tax=Bremerella sp. P1 TaxID=3026424 RepID=UPI002367D161|nr:hypothetical protein [Bremerella sp. P1]WDI41912.1 hypothetical protein PSR63_26010 [Bremerella sp. P1]